MRIGFFEQESCELLKAFWSTHFSFEVDLLETQDFKKTWAAFSKQCDLFYIPEKLNEGVFQTFYNFPTEVALSKSVDSIFYLDHKWWPQNFLIQALKQSIVKKNPHLDIRGAGYVTGQGAKARAAMFLLSQMGFAKIYWVLEEALLPEDENFSFGKKFLGTEIQVLENSMLTMQASNGSILINTMSSDNQDLIKDLSYLNFLHKNGVVVDLNLFPLKSFLLDEAENAKVLNLSGSEVSGLRDYTMLHRAQAIPKTFTEFQYLDLWHIFLKTRLTSS